MAKARSAIGAAVLLTGWAWGAAAGEHVERLADGTVLLKLGPAYENAVIETSVDELGPLLGGASPPFAGTTVRVLTHSEGPHGPISGPIEALRPVWEELTGAHLELGLVPISELYADLMLDLGRGRGSYDAAVVAAFFYGDLIAGNNMAPVDPLLASGKFPRWSYDSMPPALRQLYSWDNVGYGVLNDADGQVLYYRRDVLNDPANQTAFKAALGYDLPIPPQTWQQVLDIARFFSGKNWDHHDSQPDSGMVLHLKPGEQGFYHFQSLSAAFAVAPGTELDRYHNVYWFDPQDMKPLINEAGDVAALELLQELGATGPADQIGWRLPQAWDYFLRGKAVMMFTWGDLGALCQDPARSLVRGNCGVAMLPGSSRYWDREHAQWIEPAEPNRVGNTTGGSWHGVLLVARRQPGRGLFLPGADGDQAGLAMGRAAWLDRHQSRLPLSDVAARRVRRDLPTISRPAGTAPTCRSISPPSRRHSTRRPCCPISGSAARPSIGRSWTRSSPRQWVGARRRSRRSTTPLPPGTKSPTDLGATSSGKRIRRP